MKNEFTPYEQALALKELGFNEPCLSSWNFHTNELNFNGQPSTFSSEDVIQLPTFTQAFRWFRERYNIIHKISNVHHPYIDKIQYSYNLDDSFPKTLFNTYEEAELACLIKLIETVKQQN